MKNKKEHILNTAKFLFAEKGFEKTSVATICEIANVSKGLVYHHFNSKDEILIAIYEQSTKDMIGFSDLEIKMDPSEKLVEIIEAVFYQLFNVVKGIFIRIDEQQSELLTYVFIAEIDGIALSYLSSFEEYPIQEMKKHLIKKYKND